MTMMTKTGAIIKINLLLGSNAKNYFESKERLFLLTLLENLQKDHTLEQLDNKQTDLLQKIYLKYQKHLQS